MRRNPPQPGETASANLRNAQQLLQFLAIDILESGNIGEKERREWRRDVAAIKARVDAAVIAIESGEVHRNPTLAIFGNPPLRLGRKYRDIHGPVRLVGEISGEVDAILYRHANDGKHYRHDFEHSTSLLAIQRGEYRDVLITSPDGNAIWQDF